MIKGRKPGDNITLMNTIYFRKVSIGDGYFPKKNYNDCIALIYKDCDTGLKYVQEIEDPDYEYFIVKDGKQVDYNRTFISVDDVTPVKAPYMDLTLDIAKRTKKMDFYKANIASGNYRSNGELHMDPNVFNSDMDIEDHYQFRFGKLYKNAACPITKSYFDIETDTINMMGDFPEMGECPINAITLILQDQQLVYTFLLRNSTNPLIDEFEEKVKSGEIFPELEAFVVDAVGGPKMAEKYNIHFKYNFLFYDAKNEIELISDLFKAINNYKPDFALAWNMGFDVPYIIQRIKNLGYDPVDIMCHPDFKNKIASYFVDERMKNEFAERGDYASISCYTTYLDQMIHFASRRKGQSKPLAYTLDFIGEMVAKVRKLDYKSITTNISELPYKDYKTFVFYNIMDTIVQYCIEFVTGDIDYVFGKYVMNATRYCKIHRNTVYLKNRGSVDFWKEGFVLGNNANKFNSRPEEKFPGAFVADSLKINDYSRFRIYGKPVNIFDYCDDFDYASLYPSIIRQFNIFAHTQVGMIKIEDQVYDKENRLHRSSWTRGGQFVEDFQSHVWLEICTRWFHLSDYTTLYHEVEEFFKTMATPTFGIRFYERNGLTDPFIITKGQLYEPMTFDDNRDNLPNVYREPNLNRWEVWRNDTAMHPNQQF